MQRGNLMSSTARGFTVSSSRIPQKTTSLSVSKLTDSMARLNTTATSGSQTPTRKQPPTQQKILSPTTKNPQNERNPFAKTTTTRVSGAPPKLVPVNGVQKTTSTTTRKNNTVSVERKVPTPPGMAACKICGRHFNADRINLHQDICAKAAKKKRKVFDPVQHRLRGTEAESMITKIKMDAKNTQQPTKKTNWRRQHEEFISNIRAARKVKEHLAKGGKLSELPPPPPLDTSDYIPCPHCGRKFNEAAAERHIPKCVNIRHNKPKPVPAAANGNANKLTRNKATTRKR